MASRSRKAAERRGRWAEHYAALWLRLKGYAIVAHRVKLPIGEIDLIARRGTVLAFVEVKQRQTKLAAQKAVPDRAWLRISNAAAVWTSKQPNLRPLEWRYDLVAVVPWALPCHYPDYWRP